MKIEVSFKCFMVSHACFYAISCLSPYLCLLWMGQEEHGAHQPTTRHFWVCTGASCLQRGEGELTLPFLPFKLSAWLLGIRGGRMGNKVRNFLSSFIPREAIQRGIFHEGFLEWESAPGYHSALPHHAFWAGEGFLLSPAACLGGLSLLSTVPGGGRLQLSFLRPAHTCSSQDHACN